MSWLLGDGATRADALGLRPELAAKHLRLLDAIWAGPVSPVILELCRLRMATLLRCAPALAERSAAATAAGLTEDHIARLPSWPHDPAFSDAERACLEFAEKFVIDHHSITDEDTAAVVAAVGEPGAVALATALGVWECQHRLDKALGVSQAKAG
jgi:alkylhydroperoxidase family enzyme